MNRDTFRPELLAVQRYFLYIRVIPPRALRSVATLFIFTLNLVIFHEFRYL